MGLVLERLDSIDRHLVELIGMKAEQMRQEYGDGGRESEPLSESGSSETVLRHRHTGSWFNPYCESCAAEGRTENPTVMRAAANPATPPLETNIVEARYICLACMNPEGYRAWHFEKGSNHRRGERAG